MTLIRLAVQRPTAVTAVVLMILLMGWLALQSIPIQLTPDVRKPLISVSTSWPGAAPAEVEREIVERQEEALKGLDGLERMEGRARRGGARIILEFAIGQDIDRLLLLVNNRLAQVSDLPDEARRPRLYTRDAEDRPVAWLNVRTLPGTPGDIENYRDLVEDLVQDRMEREPGVAVVNVRGGRKRELQVIVEPRQMARYGLTIADVAAALSGTNINISAGDLDEGKRRYTVRTESELTTLTRARSVPLRSGIDPETGRIARVTVGHVADVRFGYKPRSAVSRSKGENNINISVIRDTGTNVIRVMDRIRRVTEELNKGALRDAGLAIHLDYDETDYIRSSIALVTQNIWVGGSMAVAILYMFLRSFGATLAVALAIPISIVGAFVAMSALGRSINLISLAGLAFAVGMVVDAAIVVLENIFRLRQQGIPAMEAAARGASQVWGAVFVSAVTTVAAFAPVLVMDMVVGQLFRDIAVALSVAVLLSLCVAGTVVPGMAARMLANTPKTSETRGAFLVIDRLAARFVDGVGHAARFAVRRRAAGLATVAVICGTAAAVTGFFPPSLDFLPDGKRNLLFAIARHPPGYNLKTTLRMAEEAEQRAQPHWASSEETVSNPDDPPKMSRFWFTARKGRSTFAAASVAILTFGS